MNKKWELNEANDALINKISEEFNVSKLVANIIANKGIELKGVKELIDQELNIDDLLKSKIDFGLVTVRLKDLKPLYLFKSDMEKDKIKDFCEEHHCNCSHSIIKSAIKHTVSITLFLLAITFILNLGFHYLGYDKISKLFLKDNLFGSFISSLIGLIPNCASSVMLTKLYLEGVISFYSCLAGLLTSSGVALLLLFKVNENKKENLKILLTVYLIGALSGFIMELVCSLF